MLSVEHDKLKRGAARLSVLSNTILVIAKLVVGILSGSVSILSEAVHSGIDLVAALIAWYSVRESDKPADDKHRFGHGKIENVAGTIEAVLIFGAAIFIIVEAGKKLTSGTVEIDRLGSGVAVMAISSIANYFVSRHLIKVARLTDSIALEADALHLRTDVYTAAGVLVGLVAIKLTGIVLLDPIVAILVALMIIKAAWELVKSASSQILDVKLPDEDERIIHEVFESFAGRALECHKLRTRKAGHIRHIDMHIRVPKHCTVEEGHHLSHEIERKIEEQLSHSQVLIHIEPCRGNCESCPAKCSR